jgi:hypothetical protein
MTDKEISSYAEDYASKYENLTLNVVLQRREFIIKKQAFIKGYKKALSDLKQLPKEECMTDKEKLKAIKAEIEKKIKVLSPFTHQGSDTCGKVIRQLESLVSFIDSLPEEPVNSVWHDSNKEQPKNMSTVVVWDGSYGEVLTNCVKVNPGRMWAYMDDMLNKKEEDPVSNDLEEEIERHIKECLDIKFPTTNIKMIAKDVEYTARKFFELGLKVQKGEKV